MENYKKFQKKLKNFKKIFPGHFSVGWGRNYKGIKTIYIADLLFSKDF